MRHIIERSEANSSWKEEQLLKKERFEHIQREADERLRVRLEKRRIALAEQRLQKEAQTKHEKSLVETKAMPAIKMPVMSDEDYRLLLLTKIKQHIYKFNN